MPRAAAADRPPGRYVVCPAGVLVELLVAVELGGDELLLRLRKLGLMTSTRRHCSGDCSRACTMCLRRRCWRG